MTDHQPSMLQGTIDKFTVIRNGEEIDYPEIVGTKNQRVLFAANYVDYLAGTGSSQGVGMLALTATAPTKFDTLSGSTFSYTASTGAFNRVTGSSVMNVPNIRKTVLTSNGLVGLITPTAAGTSNAALFWSLSNGLSAEPVRHFADFTGVSAKLFQGPVYTGFPYVATAANTAPTYMSAFSTSNQSILKRIYTWSTDVVAVNNTIGSITIGNRNGLYDLLSINTEAHIILPVPVAVLAGDQIAITYSLSAAINNEWGRNVTMSEYVAGWPFRYNITNLSGNGTNVTAAVAATPAMHFLSGDRITVEAVPLRKAVTSINSNGTIWTVAATAHSYTPGQSILHENISNIAYNGIYVVNTTPDANTYTVANVTNPGASSGGTTRLDTPGTYYSGEYTVLSTTATTVVFANTTTTPAPDIATCILSSPDRAKLYTNGPATQAVYSFGNCHTAIFNQFYLTATPLPSSPYHNTLLNVGTAAMYTTNIGALSIPPQISLGINALPTSAGNNGDATVNGYRRIKRIASWNHSNNNFTPTTVSDFCTFIELEVPQPKHQGYTLIINPPRLPTLLYADVPAYANA